LAWMVQEEMPASRGWQGSEARWGCRVKPEKMGRRAVKAPWARLDLQGFPEHEGTPEYLAVRVLGAPRASWGLQAGMGLRASWE